MPLNLTEISEAKKLLKLSYQNHKMSKDDIAYELHLGIPALKNYVQFTSDTSDINNFLDHVKSYSFQTIYNKIHFDKRKFYQILYSLHLRFQRFMITKEEYLTYINHKIKLSRLNERIRDKKDIPIYYKYKSFRFSIVDVAYFLASQQDFQVPTINLEHKINIDTLRIYVKNYDINLLLQFYKDQGYHDHFEKYTHSIYFSPNDYLHTSPLLRVTYTHNNNLGGFSIEFYGLKTYDDTIDKQRKEALDIFFLFVNEHNISRLTSITKIDIAFDFEIEPDKVTVYGKNRSYCNDFNNSDNEVVYKAKRYRLNELLKNDNSATYITLDTLTQQIQDRFNAHTPLEFEREWFEGVQDITPSDVLKKWLLYNYDILVLDAQLQIRSSYTNKTAITDLKLKRQPDRCIVYDKAYKAHLKKALTRIEFSFKLTGKSAIPWDTFLQHGLRHPTLERKLKQYYVYINMQYFNSVNTCHL